MTAFAKVSARLLAALLLTPLLGLTSDASPPPATPISTIEGQLVFLDCVSFIRNADLSVHFTHKAPCLARAKHDHGRLFFPGPNHVLHDLVLDIFVDSQHYYHLDELSPTICDTLFTALLDAASTSSRVVISVTAPFDPTAKYLEPISVRIVKIEPNTKQPYVLESREQK